MDHDVTIRPLRVEDAPRMVEVLSSSELYVHIGGAPPTEEQLSETYKLQTVGFSPDRTQEWMNWIVLAGGDPVGYVQASRTVGSKTAEIAWVIGVPWQRRGYATAAVASMIDELVSRGVDEVVADIHPANKPSERVARHIGMQPTDQIVDGEVRWTGNTGRQSSNRTFQ